MVKNVVKLHGVFVIDCNVIKFTDDGAVSPRRLWYELWSKSEQQ